MLRDLALNRPLSSFYSTAHLPPSLLRTSPTGLPAATVLGKYVTVEPGCVLRSCRVGDYCLVGARSVLCEGSMMEEGSILGPGEPTRGWGYWGFPGVRKLGFRLMLLLCQLDLACVKEA